MLTIYKFFFFRHIDITHIYSYIDEHSFCLFHRAPDISIKLIGIPYKQARQNNLILVCKIFFA